MTTNRMGDWSVIVEGAKTVEVVGVDLTVVVVVHAVDEQVRCIGCLNRHRTHWIDKSHRTFPLHLWGIGGVWRATTRGITHS